MKICKQISFKGVFNHSTLNRFININNSSVWILFNELAAKVKGVNLVSGFPNWDPPEFLIESLQTQLTKDNSVHQRTSSNGHPFFLETLASHYSTKYNRKIDPLKEICVTPGANYAINHAILSLLNPNDEVLSLEPFYPEYLPEAYMGGGTFKGVPLIPPLARSREEYRKMFESKEEIKFNKEKDEWKIDFGLLRKSFNSRTKVFILNNPNNPTGKIFTLDELKEIANILKDFPRVVVISDEVYEKVCFEDNFIDIPRFANLPNMWDRTINVLSAGKIYSATGLRMGWAIGPSNLIEPITQINARNVGCLYPPIQIAVAEAFIKSEENYKGEKTFYEWSRKNYLKGRNRLLKSLAYSSMDFKFWTPQSGYFVLADFQNIAFDEKYYFDNTSGKNSKDYAFALWLGNEKKVVGVPTSVFYSPENKLLTQNLIRFACCKTEDYFKEVDKKLQ